MKKKPALPLHERVCALGIVGFFILLIGTNLWLSGRDIAIDIDHPHLIQSPLIEVTIVGKVKKPGIYQVKMGTPVQEVIEMAKPTDDSNLKKIKLDSKITRRRKIKIR